jgi:DNA-binding beta-propeller fold protein YncE
VFGPNGNLFVSSFDQVLEYNGRTGAFVTAFVSPGSGGLGEPKALVFGPNGNLFVSNANTNQVLEYDGTTGRFVSPFVSAGSGGVVFPLGLVFGPNGNLFVGNGFLGSGLSGQVLEYDSTTCAFVAAFVSGDNGGLGEPADLADSGETDHLFWVQTDHLIR